MAGIKEMSEILDCATTLVNDLVAAKAADGKIDWSDVIALAIKDAPQAVQAVLGAGEAFAEAKDLDAAEAKVIAEKGLALGLAVVKLFQGPKA